VSAGIRYVLLRLLQAVAVVWAAFTLTWAILYALPSDPASIIAAGGLQGDTADPTQVEALRVRMGLDRPAALQYLSALGHTVTGDWGTSYQSGRPVTTTLLDALPPTLAVAGLGFVLALLLGSGIGFAATYVRSPVPRQILLSLPAVGASIPTFWSALMLIQVFSFSLGWFPAFGNQGFSSTVLPAIALAVPISAVIAQVFAAALRSVMAEPWLDTARAKGASRLRAQTRHAVRAAGIPVLTMAGLLVGTLLSGTVVIETVFGRQGFGRITVDAVSSQDIPVVMGVVTFSATVFVLITLLVDLVLPALDPRIRPAHNRTRPAGESGARTSTPEVA